jgi:hypothetical protein
MSLTNDTLVCGHLARANEAPRISCRRGPKNHPYRKPNCPTRWQFVDPVIHRKAPCDFCSYSRSYQRSSSRRRTRTTRRIRPGIRNTAGPITARGCRGGFWVSSII